MVVKLKVMHGPSAGKEIKISGPSFVIGRGDDCHLRPKSDAISRRHCQISIGDSQVSARDLGSKNGTLVNGDRIEGDRVLKTGDCLKVGPLDFEIVIDVGIVSGEKRPKVHNVKEAAARVADSSVIDSDVGSWLQELDEIEKEKQSLDPATRQFKLEETDRVALEEAATKELKTPETTEAKVEDTQSGTKKLKVPEKKPPMKLPPRPETPTANSRDAAADMLKRFFNRR